MSTNVLDDDESPIQSPRLSPPLQNTGAPRDGEPSDLRELAKWQQERLERRLRGEYESQVHKLFEVVSGNFDQPARIMAIRVEGAPNTRESFLASIIKPHFRQPPFPYASSSSTPPSSFGDVLHTTQHISSLLQDTKIFKSVQTSLERSGLPFAGENDVDVVFRCKERGKFFLKTATDIGNQEGSASATGRLLNAFGGAETLEGNIAFGTKTKQAYHLRLEAPLVHLDHSLRTRGEISAFGLQRDNSSFASSSEGVNGLKLSLKTVRQDTTHEFAYELSSRHIGNLSDKASLSMREAAGQSTKSALSHTFLHDSRDDTMGATRGIYSKIFTEVSGFGGDAAHLKSESIIQASRRVTNGLSLSFSSGLGILYPLTLFGSRPVTAPSLFSDRFQVGGPLSVRMFKQNGLGPRDGPDSLGGDLCWSAGVSAIADIPKRPSWPIKLHGFINAGRLDGFDRSKPIDLMGSLQRSLRQPSVSAGVGLIYRFDPVRVEVNFGVPLVASASDLGRRGFQVGMGLEFL